MKNNTINEITRIKKLMLINEASIIKWKFGETFQPKIESKLNAMNDADVKAWNIEVKKPNPYRQGVDNIEKIDNACKAFDCKPYFALVIDEEDMIKVFILSKYRLIEYFQMGQGAIGWKMTKSWIDKYNNDNDIIKIDFQYKTKNWW